MPNVDKIIEDLIKGASRAGAKVELHDGKGHEVKLANLEALMGAMGHGGGGGMPPQMGGDMSGGGMPPQMGGDAGGGMGGIPPEIMALLEQLCSHMGGGGGGHEAGPPMHGGGGPPEHGKGDSPFPPKKKDGDKDEKKPEKKDAKKDDDKGGDEKEAMLKVAFVQGMAASAGRYKVAFIGPLLGLAARVAGPALAQKGLGAVAGRAGAGALGRAAGAGAKLMGGTGMGAQMAQMGAGELAGQAADRMTG